MSRRSPILLRIISLVLVVISLQYVQIVARTTGAQAAPLPNSIMIQNRARGWQIESIGFELELDHKAAHRVDCATTPTSTVYKATAADTYIGSYSTTITNVVTWASTWFASPKTQTRVFYLDDPHDEAKPGALDRHGQSPGPRVRVVLDLVWMPQGKKWYLDALKTWTCWVSLCDQGMSVDPKLGDSFVVSELSGDSETFTLSLPLPSTRIASTPDVSNEEVLRPPTRMLDISVEYKSGRPKTLNLGHLSMDGLKSQWAMTKDVLSRVFQKLEGY